MNIKKYLLPAILTIACAFGQSTTDKAKDAAEKTAKGVKKVAEKTAEVTKDAAKDTAKGTKKVAEKTADVTKKGAEKTAEVTKDAAKDTAKGTKKVAEKTAEVTKDAAKDTAKGTKKVAEKTAEVTKDAAKETKKGAEKAAGAVTGKPAAEKGGTANAKEIADAKAKGLVWINLDSKIYHKEGQFYGTTKNGKFMTEAEAQKMGGRAAK